MENYPKSVSKQNLKIILEQMENSICKINKKQIGFFCNIRYKNKTFPILITSYKAINELYMINNINFKVIINGENKTLDFGELNYFNKYLNLSIIEIKPNNDIKIKFLDLDEKIFEKGSEMIYNNESIYIIHYNKDTNVYVSYGTINDINNSEIVCSCNIDSNSEGSPIFNLSIPNVISKEYFSNL